jgi:hypothetical protein
LVQKKGESRAENPIGQQFGVGFGHGVYTNLATVSDLNRAERGVRQDGTTCPLPILAGRDRSKPDKTLRLVITRRQSGNRDLRSDGQPTGAVQPAGVHASLTLASASVSAPASALVSPSALAWVSVPPSVSVSA